MPAEALSILTSEAGPILDVGGGAAPYGRAAHVLDIIPFDPDRLRHNAWGTTTPRQWHRRDYTDLDIVATRRWPFGDHSFALGLCSHTLEDLRDPVPALAELGRVCQQILVITPTRLLEQTRGIDHRRYCGFFHHPWAVFRDDRGLVFRRKTANLELPGSHLVCPVGKTLPVPLGAFLYYGGAIEGRELAFWSASDDVADYRAFIAPYVTRSPFVRDPRPVTLKRRVYGWRQEYLGAH